MSIEQRLHHLEAKLGEKRAWLTVFRLEDGSTFTTELDPLTYLLQYGARGRIISYEPPPGTKDPITSAVYAEIERLGHPVKSHKKEL